ncbi:MAG: hypothetical protein L3J83_05785 [Proteobacteria bacterium]|nr:hypothetical protein [Pseudomonadota bacterium]
MKMFILALTLFSASLNAADSIFLVGPITDADCDFNTIQEAINDGNTFRHIRVSNQLSTVTGITINTIRTITLSGGYANCLDAGNEIIDLDNTSYTTISNVNGIALEIDLDLVSQRSLEISGFNFINSDGGIDLFMSNVSPEFDLNIHHVVIRDNSSTGLNLRGDNLITNLDNAQIFNNTTEFVGGGIGCVGAEVNIGETVSIHDNHADSGGGIYASLCDINLSAGDMQPLDSLEFGVFQNTVTFEGAGIYLSRSNLTGRGTLSHPVSITKNAAIQGTGSLTKGGGIMLASGSFLRLTNARVEANSSFFAGGAIAAVHQNPLFNAPFIVLLRDLDGCNYADICTFLSDNSTTNLVTSKGAAIYLDRGSFAYLSQMEISGNHSENSSIFHIEGASILSLTSDLIINNSTSGSLLNSVDESQFISLHSTYSNNDVDNYFNIQYDNSNPQLLDITGSIIKNGSATLADLNNDGGNHDAEIKCSLVENNDNTGVLQNNSIIGDPGFIQSGSFQLREDSIALDSPCTVVGEFELSRYDIIGHDRIRDLAPDLGVYERFVENVFSNGFE